MELLALALLVTWIVGFIYLGKIDRLSQEVERLKSALIQLQAQGAARAVSRPEHPIAAAPPAVTAAGIRPVPPPHVISPPPMPGLVVEQIQREAAPRPMVQPSVPRAPSALERWFQTARTTDEWEALIGGRWLNRIGAVALVLGAGFFLKYAFDHDWISPTLRVAMGVTAGLVILALAYRSNRRGYEIFAQGLVGAGISILYLSVYASFNFYHLVPQPLALAAMAAVTVVGFLQALYYDSLVVSLLAWFGGFLTPILLMTEGASELGLAIYVALLVTGILLLVTRKAAWFILEPLTMGGAFGVYLLWYLKSYTEDALPLALIFATILWALFYAKDVYDIVRQVQPFLRARHALGVTNGVLYYGILLALLLVDHRAWMAAASLALGAVYCSTVLVVTRGRRTAAGVAERYALTSIVLLALATTIEFSGFTAVILWGLEAFLLLGVGMRYHLWYVSWPALTLYGLSVARLLVTEDTWYYASVQRFHPLLNQRALAFLTLSAIAGVTAFAFARVRDARLPETSRRTVQHMLQYLCCTLPFILLTVETNDFFRSHMLHASGWDFDQLGYTRFLAIGAVWTLYATILVWTGLRLKLTPVLLSGLGATALTVIEVMTVGVRFVPIERFTLLLNARAGVMVLLGVGLFLQLRWLRRWAQRVARLRAVRASTQVVLLALGFEFLTVEVNDYFGRLIAGSGGLDATSYGFTRFMIVAGLWTLYSLPIVRYGVWKKHVFVVAGGLSITGLSVLLAASIGVAYRPAEWFMPVLNIRAGVFVLLLAGLFLQLQALRRGPAMHRWTAGFLLAIQGALVLVGFELVSVEVRDFFQKAIVTGNTSMGTVDDLHNMQQLGLSVVWLLYAALLLAIGIWQRTRWLRFGALALFAVAIAKVFLYDLSFLGGAYRSISFAGLGVILLAVSFFYQRFKGVLFGHEENQRPQGPVRRPPHQPRPVS